MKRSKFLITLFGLIIYPFFGKSEKSIYETDKVFILNLELIPY